MTRLPGAVLEPTRYKPLLGQSKQEGLEVPQLAFDELDFISKTSKILHMPEEGKEFRSDTYGPIC